MPDRSAVEVVTEALSKAPERKFSESVELSVNLKDLDLTVPKNRLEDEVPLPKGRGNPPYPPVARRNRRCPHLSSEAGRFFPFSTSCSVCVLHLGQ